MTEHRHGTAERATNVLLGLSVLSWGLLGIVRADPAARFTAVRLTLASVNLVAGSLFILRAPLVRQPHWGWIGLSIPAFVAGGFSLHSAPAAHTWPLAAQVVFTAGGVALLTSLIFLGRSFAVLPAVRDIVSRGPYAHLRHPAYASELVMVLACPLASPTWAGRVPAAAAVLLQVVRIVAEERALSGEEAFREYTSRVRWRLIPHVW